ncbi:MAG: hypothetical protein IPM54_04635 [Polyangiaceae bacterium]|nr:hypothetical protein [Polyangiaceae bacterium]
MHIRKSLVAALLFVAASGCTGSTPPAKSTDGGATASGTADGKQAECDAIAVKFKEIDDAVKGSKGVAGGRLLVPALEKLSRDFQAAPMKTPGLDKATVELVAQADIFTSRMKQLTPIFDEIEKINDGLMKWQEKLGKAADDFDAACSKAPPGECDKLGPHLTKMPHLEGDQYAEFAKDIETYQASTANVTVKDAPLDASFKSLVSVLAEAILPMRRLAELRKEPKKLDLEADTLKAKFNAVREMCGMPVR